MDYIRFSRLDDELVQITSIAEEEENELESNREISLGAGKNDGSKSANRRSVEEKSLEILPEKQDYPTTLISGTRKSKRLGFKVSVNQEAEFPLLVRGFDSEKTKDSELIKKRSLKQGFFRQNSLEDEKAEIVSNKSEALPIQIDSLESEEFDDGLLLRTPSIVINEESSFASLGKDLANLDATSVRLFNIEGLQKVLKGGEPYENLLYLAIHDGAEELPELKSGFLERIGFSNKKKESFHIDSALEACTSSQILLESTQSKNQELKRQLEALQNDRKKKQIEYNSIRTSINTILSGINDEKVTVHAKIKNIEMQILDSLRRKNELNVSKRETVKNLMKNAEAKHEVEEVWKMNIDDLRVVLVEILNQKQAVELKMLKNQTLLEELKTLERQRIFYQDQTDFSLEMLVRTMEFFAESKDHESFNVKSIQKSFKEALTRVKEASSEAIEANSKFEEQATKDPREVIPYMRVSDQVPSKKADRIMLSNKNSRCDIRVQDQ